MRREFQLPEEDIHFLDSYGLPWEAVKSNGLWVLIHNFPTLHQGYNHNHVTTAVRIETGYPNAALDMVYFHPHLSRTDGKEIKATKANQNIDGKKFQRWSRHYTPQNPYDMSQPNLGNHILTIEDWLLREFDK